MYFIEKLLLQVIHNLINKSDKNKKRKYLTLYDLAFMIPGYLNCIRNKQINLSFVCIPLRDKTRDTNHKLKK